jgi:hypothetical protein
MTPGELNVCQAERSVAESDATGFSWIDAAILLGFALFSVGSFLGRWKGVTPFVFLGSDAGIVSSFVAAYEHPDLFRADALLSDATNFKYYIAAHPALIYALNRIIGDYGTAYVSLLLLTPLLQSAGFYLLGRILFRSRYWALLLAVITLFPIALPIRELWGVYDDPLPRSLFHACLPYVLAAAFRYKSVPRMWPLVMLAIGMAFYTHPVSAPHWAFALWLGFWPFLPSEWTWFRKWGTMLGLGLIFVATVLPWAVNLVMVHDREVTSTVQYKDVVSIIAARVGKELLDIRIALGLWWDAVRTWPLWLYCSLAVVLSLHLARTRRDLRKDLSLVAIWVVGILFVAVGLTFIEETVCRWYDVRRFQMDSVRGIKYLFPLILLMCLWPLAEIAGRLPARSLSRSGVLVAGALLVAVWAYQFPPRMFVDTAKAWRHGSMLPPLSSTEKAVIEALDAVRKNTPPGSRILALALPLEIRYSALRPVAYAYKDGGIFADTNLGELREWEACRKEIERIAVDPQDRSRLERALNLSTRLKANYLFTDFPVQAAVASSLGAELIWSNNQFALLLPSQNHRSVVPDSQGTPAADGR